jgi:hypothetical protein
VPDRGEKEVEEEVTNPFVSVHRAVWRSVSDTVRSFRRQAPGARMIGEFAVKHVVNEAQKKFGGGDEHNNTPIHDNGGSADDQPL